MKFAIVLSLLLSSVLGHASSCELTGENGTVTTRELVMDKGSTARHASGTLVFKDVELKYYLGSVPMRWEDAVEEYQNFAVWSGGKPETPTLKEIDLFERSFEQPLRFSKYFTKISCQL